MRSSNRIELAFICALPEDELKAELMVALPKYELLLLSKEACGALIGLLFDDALPLELDEECSELFSAPFVRAL